MLKEKVMLQMAEEMLDHAYVPYSRFPVGAALLTSTGEVIGGCNIENASFGLTNCAERTAMFRAWASGYKNFSGLLIIGETETPVSPCGACRQVIAEFCAPDMPVILMNTKGDRLETTVESLLPGYFKAEDMRGSYD